MLLRLIISINRQPLGSDMATILRRAAVAVSVAAAAAVLAACGSSATTKDVGGGLVVQVQEAGWPVRAYRGWLFGTLVEQLLRARRIDPRTISDLSFAADIPGRRPAEQGRSVRFADPASVSVPHRAAPVDEVRQGCHFTFSGTFPFPDLSGWRPPSAC